MFLSVIITTYWVLGVKYEKEKQTSFRFILPFTSFRDVSNEMYWQEVVDKIYDVSGADKDCDIYVATQEEYLLSSDYFKNVARISDILTKNSLPLVYLGETRGSVKGVVTPFIINPNDFYRWFYLAENINSVENYFYNRRAYGVREPAGSWEQGFEESLFREKLTYLIENTRNDFFEKTKDLILTGEGVIFAGGNKRIVLSFLDSTKPGFWRIYIDKDTLLLNLELVKIFNEEEYKLRAGKIKVEDLAGCLVVPNAQKLELKDASNTLVVNLEKDAISVIPFDKDNNYQVKAYIGKDSTFFEVSGGELGLIVDNRIRPLLRDKSSKQRIGLIEKWTKEISQKVDLGNVDQQETGTPMQKKILESEETKPQSEETEVADNNTAEVPVSTKQGKISTSSMVTAAKLLSEGVKVTDDTDKNKDFTDMAPSHSAENHPKAPTTQSGNSKTEESNAKLESEKSEKSKNQQPGPKDVQHPSEGILEESATKEEVIKALSQEPPKTTDMKSTLPLEEEHTDKKEDSKDSIIGHSKGGDSKSPNIESSDSKKEESNHEVETEEVGRSYNKKPQPESDQPFNEKTPNQKSTPDKELEELVQKELAVGSVDHPDIISSHSELDSESKKTKVSTKDKKNKTSKENPKLRPGEKVL